MTHGSCRSRVGLVERKTEVISTSGARRFKKQRNVTHPKFNCLPLKNGGWKLEDKPFLLGFGNFSGANC